MILRTNGVDATNAPPMQLRQPYLLLNSGKKNLIFSMEEKVAVDWGVLKKWELK